MRSSVVCILLSTGALLTGCTMFGAWKAIPPPGGCDQCHSVPINSRWSVTYKAAALSRSDNAEVFQTPEYTMRDDRPTSPMEIQKLEEAKCFDCHKEPSPAHRQRKGRFHH